MRPFVKIFFGLFIVLLMQIGVLSPVFAQSVQSLGASKAWAAYSTVRSATSLCFMHSKPVSVEPQIEGVGQAYFYVTHRPSENVKYEMNLVAGFDFDTDSLAIVTIGSQEFSLFTEADAAWLEDPKLSADMAAAMRRGSSMKIDAVNKKGQRVSFTFSLSGATASMRKIDSACQI